MEVISLVEMSSTNSETLVCAIEKKTYFVKKTLALKKDNSVAKIVQIQCQVSIMLCKEECGIMHPMQYT